MSISDENNPVKIRVFLSYSHQDEKLKDEVVVVTAHYDHLGKRGESDEAPEQNARDHDWFSHWLLPWLA